MLTFKHRGDHPLCIVEMADDHFVEPVEKPEHPDSVAWINQRELVNRIMTPRALPYLQMTSDGCDPAVHVD